MNFEICFNSLQTGKPIQSRSNAKCGDKCHNQVSIPFKRESLSKGRRLCSRVSCSRSCFNSLQTGKPIQRNTVFLPKTNRIRFQFPSNGKAYPKTGDDKGHQMIVHLRFNSLQTGKPIQSKKQRKNAWHARTVSIPFKRESLSKVLWAVQRTNSLSEMFQFPSNGKAYPKSVCVFFTNP